MKLPRPYIPYKIRAMVAERQADAKGFRTDPKLPANLRLRSCLIFLFGTAKVHLDHDPPLMLRDVIMHNGKVKYLPDANDPNYLRYVNAESHRVKTFIKGEGARRSDMGQRRYLKRVHAKQNPKPRFKPRAAKHIRRVK